MESWGGGLIYKKENLYGWEYLSKTREVNSLSTVNSRYFISMYEEILYLPSDCSELVRLNYDGSEYIINDEFSKFINFFNISDFTSHNLYYSRTADKFYYVSGRNNYGNIKAITDSTQIYFIELSGEGSMQNDSSEVLKTDCLFGNFFDFSEGQIYIDFNPEFQGSDGLIGIGYLNPTTKEFGGKLLARRRMWSPGSGFTIDKIYETKSSTTTSNSPTFGSVFVHSPYGSNGKFVVKGDDIIPPNVITAPMPAWYGDIYSLSSSSGYQTFYAGNTGLYRYAPNCYVINDEFYSMYGYPAKCYHSTDMLNWEEFGDKKPIGYYNGHLYFFSNNMLTDDTDIQYAIPEGLTVQQATSDRLLGIKNKLIMHIKFEDLIPV